MEYTDSMNFAVNQGGTDRRRGVNITVNTDLPSIVFEAPGMSMPQNASQSVNMGQQLIEGSPNTHLTPLTPSSSSPSGWLGPPMSPSGFSSGSRSPGPTTPSSSNSSPHGSFLHLHPSPSSLQLYNPSGLVSPLELSVNSLFQASPSSFHFPNVNFAGNLSVDASTLHSGGNLMRNLQVPMEHDIREVGPEERIASGKEYVCLTCNVQFVSWANAQRHRKKDDRIHCCPKCFKTYARNDYRKAHEKRCHRGA